MYDSDAVVLKNPQPLFEANAGVELVGSAGKGPESIGHVWGRTICTGVLLMRSSPDLGEGIGILSAVLSYTFISFIHCKNGRVKTIILAESGMSFYRHKVKY